MDEEMAAADLLPIARVVDANANRLRESLRVLEDYARFVLEDSGISGQLKESRHLLREALEFIPEQWRIAARETERDVGTGLDSADEHSRSNLLAVVSANCKRAQEALRTLEECAKVQSESCARQLQQLRYRLYGLERVLLVSSRSRDRLQDVVLYWVADPDGCVGPLEEMVRQAISGGVQIVQLRDKSSSDRELLGLAQLIRKWTSESEVLFLVNDRPDIARLAQADGLHIGQKDLSVHDARRIVGPELLIGVSTHSIQQARRAVRDGADYIGVGPVFPSRTKEFAKYPGLDFVRQIAEEISLPAFCIGGIDATNLEQVLWAGGSRIAVGDAVSSCEDPEPIARNLRNLVENRKDVCNTSSH